VLDALVARRVRTAAIRAVIALVPILGWNGLVVHVERSPDYTRPAYAYQRADYIWYNVSYARNVSLRDPFNPEEGRASVLEVAQRGLVNLAHMPKRLGTAVTARPYSWERLKELPTVGPFIPWRVILYLPIVLGVIVLFGVARLLTGDARLIGLYIVLMAAGICLTPWPWQGHWERYWAPVMPFLALALAVGLMTLTAWSARLPRPVRGASRAGLIALVVAVLAMEVLVLTRMYAHRYPATVRDLAGHVGKLDLFFYDQPHQALEVVVDWLGRRARPGDVVAASTPLWLYLRTGLKSVMPPFETDPARAQALLDSVPVRFVVVDGVWPPVARDYALPLLARSPERWECVYSDRAGKVEIYQRRSEPTASHP
jgi:hypothetical protein